MPETPLDRFFALERAKYGKADYYFKPNRTESKVRAFYARPFCPRYMQSFSTVMYPDTYFAAKKGDDLQSCLETEYHENVHKWDRWNQGFIFTLKYLWPHWVAVPFILAAVVLGGLWGWAGLGVLLALVHAGLGILALSAKKQKDGIPSKTSQVCFFCLSGIGVCGLIVATIIGGGCWAFLWCGALLFISPWPLRPVWRRDAELRGYTMSLYRIWLKYKNRFDVERWSELIEYYVKCFSGPAYFFMEIDKQIVRSEFIFQCKRFRENEDAFLSAWCWFNKTYASTKEAEPYRMAKYFIEEEGFGG